MTPKQAFAQALPALLLAPLLLSPAPAQGQADLMGRWDTLITLPFFPVHDHLLPNGKVMIWPGDGGISGDDPRLWDPATQSLSLLRG